MSDPAWTTGTAHEGGEEARAMTMLQGDDQPPGHPPHLDPEGRDAEPGRANRTAIRLGREARLGVAALLSFLILAGGLIAHKNRSQPKPDEAASGKIPPIPRI